MIYIATTTFSISRPDQIEDDYGSIVDVKMPVASGVPGAVVESPSGQTSSEPGANNVIITVNAHIDSTADIKNNDYITDEIMGNTYEVLDAVPQPQQIIPAPIRLLLRRVEA